MVKGRVSRVVAVLLSIVMWVVMLGGMPEVQVKAAYENTHVNTGNQAEDIVAVAETQIGYKEGANNDTKYNRWNGTISGYPVNGYGYPWCQCFVSWCANQAGISTSIIPRTAGTSTGRSFFVNQGTYRQSKANGGNYVPKRGDIIYFGSGSSPSHVGIVSSCDGSTVHTIEGNYSDSVGRRSIALSNSYIIGYGVPNYSGSPTPPEPNYTLISPTPTISTLSSSSLKLTWKAVDNATSYRIDRRKSGADAYETLTTISGTTYTDIGLETNTKYWYRVYAVSGSNRSSEKNSVSGTTYTLTSPTPTVSTVSATSLKLTWKVAANATTYRIDRRKAHDGTAYETIVTTKETTYTDTGLEADTKYWYRVYAVTDYSSSEKNSVSGTTYTLTSPTPTVSTVSATSLKLTWKATTNATAYRIDRRKAHDGTAYETIVTTKETTYTDTGLEADTKYWYRVYAVADYSSSEKNSVSGTTDKIATTCNIKLYDNGQSLAENLIKSGTKLDEFLLPTPSKTGYTFEGWYTSESGGTKYSVGSTVPDVTSLNLYAHWKKVDIKGDINADTKVTTLDAIMFQKYLLNAGTVTDWQAGDLNNDGILDIFDLALLKRMLLAS